jgi:hypothetical protein
VRLVRGCLVSVSLLIWGTLGFAQEPVCPYLYVGPEAPAPAWMRTIVKHRMNVVIVPPGAVYNWTVPLRFGGERSPDNLTLMAKADVSQKLKAEEFLATCLCAGQMKVSTARKMVLDWRRHLSGESPFSPTGVCPVER